MHWFVWFLLISYCASLGLEIAKIGGYKPKPANGWIGMVVNSLIIAGIIIYLA